MSIMKLTGAALVAALMMAAQAAHAADRTATCADILRTPLDNGSLTSAKVVRPGEIKNLPDVAAGLGARPVESAVGGKDQTNPAFCRVQGVLHPAPTSAIRFEVWLPMEGWNQRYWGLGNGGTAGYISYTDLLQSVSSGYAVSSNNSGHDNGIASAETFDDPERLKDFAYRATHLTAVASKVLVQAFYGAQPEKSYFSGCSNGGRQGLIQAQRFPDDYDGIISGAPAASFPGIARSAFMASFLTADPARLYTPEKLMLVHKAAIAACDKLDGVQDGLINAPMSCKFDPGKLQCRSGADTANCLTAPQVATARRFYAGMDPAGRDFHDAMLPGTELNWTFYGVLPPSPTNPAFLLSGVALSESWMNNVVTPGGSWRLKDFDAKRDIDAVRNAHDDIIAADNPDLSAFAARGGKLIIYTGQSDSAVPLQHTVNYVDSVRRKMGPAADDVMVFFQAPGMGHCRGGDGFTSFGKGDGDDPAFPTAADLSEQLQLWVEKGVKPQAVVAAQLTGDTPPKVRATRPLCAYPKIVKLTPGADPAQAASYACVAG